MELTSLLERMKMEHLLAQLDGVCEHAAKGDLDYKGFLTQALEAEWRGRHQRGVESRLKLARLPWLKSLDQFDFDFQPSIDERKPRKLRHRRAQQHIKQSSETHKSRADRHCRCVGLTTPPNTQQTDPKTLRRTR